MARILKYLLVFAILGGGGFAAYSWMQNRESTENGLEMIGVVRGSIVEKAVAVGQIEPRVKFQVKSKISGIVKRCFAEVGDRIEPGDALFEIAPDPTPAELVQAESLVESARSAFNRAAADWRRASELDRQGIISKDVLDGDREAFELRRIELERAEDNLALTRKGRIDGRGRAMESVIRASSGGILLARHVDPGDPVVPLTTFQEGTALATIADMGDLLFKGTVDEIDVGKLTAGVEARLKIGALPSAEVTGRLSRIAPQAREEDGARLFDVEIELDPVSDIVLRAGYSANADLVIREKTDILLVPERLIIFEEDGAKTYVEIPGQGPEAEPEKIAIETGLSDGLNIEVISGLDEGDQVVQRPPRDILG